jgi:hypothetical protein
VEASEAQGFLASLKGVVRNVLKEFYFICNFYHNNKKSRNGLAMNSVVNEICETRKIQIFMINGQREAVDQFNIPTAPATTRDS